MTNVDDELREVFRTKAGEVPTHHEVPRSLRARSRRRLALNAVIALAAVVALGAGAAGGLRVLERTEGIRPETTPNPLPSDTSRDGVPACTSGQLRAVAQLEGAMGSREGAILVSNYGSTTCTLSGRPSIRVVDGAGANPAVGQQIVFTRTKPAWRVNHEPKPAGWPVVTLRPGGAASVRVRWSNWCGGEMPFWRIRIPGSGLDDVFGMDEAGPPPCNGQGVPSTIEVGPFEPAAA